MRKAILLLLVLTVAVTAHAAERERVFAEPQDSAGDELPPIVEAGRGDGDWTRLNNGPLGPDFVTTSYGPVTTFDSPSGLWLFDIATARWRRLTSATPNHDEYGLACGTVYLRIAGQGLLLYDYEEARWIRINQQYPQWVYDNLDSEDEDGLIALFDSGSWRYDCPSEPPIVLEEDLHIYVDATTGDDSADGLSWSTAKRTIQPALDMIPTVLHADVTVHIGEGSYDGDLLLMDRLAPRFNKIRIVGEGGSTVIQSSGEWAMAVFRMALVEVEGVTFDAAGSEQGLVIFECTVCTLTRCAVSGAGDIGLQIARSGVTLINTLISSNNNGLHCSHSNVNVDYDDGGGAATSFSSNDLGINARIACRVKFGGLAYILGNSSTGVSSRNGSDVDLNYFGGGDVYLSGNGTDLYTDRNGAIVNYSGANCGGPCICIEGDEGLCSP